MSGQRFPPGALPPAVEAAHPTWDEEPEQPMAEIGMSETTGQLRSGVHLPHYGPTWRRLNLPTAARLVEETGFDSVWLSDHVVLSQDPASRYPFSRDGAFFLPADADWLEWTTLAGYLAACTSTLEIGVGVCVLPLRHPCS